MNNNVNTYFSLDNRFIYREPIASGSYGSTHRVQYLQVLNGYVTATDFLVKVAHGGWEGETALRFEKEYLERLRGAMHIVKLINIPNDPLTRNNFPGSFIMLEWLPNGTIGQFIAKAKFMGLQRLPNRLLWRFFLCLVRALCGLAWPRNRTDDLEEFELPVPGVPPSGFMHNDLHIGNVLLGDFTMEPEHFITPKLKLIDFGQSGDADPEDVVAAREANIWEVGKLMLKLISLNNLAQDSLTPMLFNYLGEDIETRANLIFAPSPGQPRPFPWLDEWLATIIGLCMGVDVNRMPTYQTLSQWVQYAVIERNASYYGIPEESDETVRTICQQVILNARTH
ncbi:kinase-like domain-containing protein [Hypoxylon sp. FL1857]|nr:kinase-like domain-containing protein [Hypoxylon sp. FL1857]